MPPPPEIERRPDPWGPWVCALAVLLACLPSWGTLSAPWLAEDATILGYVEREGASADWWGPQYGLSTVRFWRPLVTQIWGWQVALVGIDPLLLRLLNVAAHAAASGFLWAILRRVGLSRLAALAGALCVGFFPEQGGTVTWLAGRTDGLVSLGLLITVWLAQGGRFWLAPASAFLACATKELGFLAPGLVALVLWAQGFGLRANLGRTLPVLAAALLALGWRRLALEAWAGGYPLANPGWSGATGVLAALRPHLLGPAALLAAAALTSLRGGGVRHPRLLLVGCAWYGAGVLPLLPLLWDGVFEAQNARLLRTADLGLGLALAALWAPRRGVWGGLGLACLWILLGWRAGAALRDTREWAEAAEVCAAQIEATRPYAEASAETELPLLFDGFPTVWHGAYALGYGVADRYRAPFATTRRAVWPERVLFGGQPVRSSAPAAVVARLGSGEEYALRDPARPQAPSLAILVDGQKQAELAFERIFLEPGRGPRLSLGGGPRAERIELILHTELGQETVSWEGKPTFLPDLLRLANDRVSLADAALFSATTGATRAGLEVRAYQGGELVGASPWLLLTWQRSSLRPRSP